MYESLDWLVNQISIKKGYNTSSTDSLWKPVNRALTYPVEFMKNSYKSFTGLFSLDEKKTKISEKPTTDQSNDTSYKTVNEPNKV